MALLAALPLGASAHNFLPEAGAVTPIPDISVSRAIYTALNNTGEIKSYTFSASEGQELFIQIDGPAAGNSALFAPALALIAKDRPLLAPDLLLSRARLADPEPYRALLGADAEDGILLALGDPGDYEGFYEPVTGTRYRIRQTLSLRAPSAGEYRIAVFSPEGATGSYILSPGRLESFTLSEILALPGIRREVREFMGEPVLPVWLPWALLGATVAAGLTLALLSLR